ncbi:MAG TPA: hypothetical protein VL087_08245 [Nitrospirota bacterium]|nr:hypothetical protein [Nitrospirota bacterium]
MKRKGIILAALLCFMLPIDAVNRIGCGLTGSHSPFVIAAPISATVAITASAGKGGSISPSGSLTVSPGGNASFIIAPDPGYLVMSVIVDGANKGAVSKYTFTNLTANHTIAAYFKPVTFTITATAEANGAISSPGVNTVNPGGSMTFTITPDDGYHVADALVDGSSVGAMTSYTFTNVTASHTIRATFAENAWFIIDSSAGSNGTISPSGRGSVLGGTRQKFTITPVAGYRVADLLVDGSSVGSLTSYTFDNVQAAHAISASFTPDVYTITASVTNWDNSFTVYGHITASGMIMVNRGDSRTYTITPNAGYVVYSVLIDGVQKGGITSYTFSDVSADHTIDAYVRPITYTITATSGSGGSISPAGVTTMNTGGSLTYTITPKEGYHIADVLIDSVSQGPIATWSFSNVMANHTIKAYFK